MQWSRLKKMLEGRVCDALKGHVHIYAARYTRDEEVGRLWMVLDKRQVFSSGDGFSPTHPEWHIKNGCVYFNRIVGRDLSEKALVSYIELSIEEALTSSQYLIKALAMFDKRVGKRRLALLSHSMPDEPLLVQHFFALRCEAENLHFECGSTRQTSSL